MLKNKLTRHASTFVMIILASALLFPASNAVTTLFIWILLAVIIASNLINLLIS